MLHLEFSSWMLHYSLTMQQLWCMWCLVYCANTSMCTALLCNSYKCRKMQTRCFVFLNSHVCISGPFFLYCISVSHACIVYNAPNILLLFTWRSHKGFCYYLSCHTFFYTITCHCANQVSISHRNFLLRKHFFFFLRLQACSEYREEKPSQCVLFPYVSISSFHSVLVTCCYQRSGYTLQVIIGHTYNIMSKLFNVCCIHVHFALLT